MKLHGAQIGSVAAVKETADGRAELQLAIDPTRLQLMPDNTLVQIGSATVFGAKSVEFETPANPSTTPLRAGQVLDSQHVTVEVNTIFEQLNFRPIAYRSGQAQRDPWCDIDGVWRPRRDLRPFADRPQLVLWPSSNRATHS